MPPQPFLRFSIYFRLHRSPPVSSGITERESRRTSQEVFPHNNPKFVQITSGAAFRPRAGVHGAELIELMGMDQAEFSRGCVRTPN
jgi:hypothetical protein